MSKSKVAMVQEWLRKETSHDNNSSTLFTEKQEWDINSIIETLTDAGSIELRLPLMRKCIEHLKLHKYTISSLQLLTKIIETYPTRSTMPHNNFIIPVRWTIIGHLQDEHNLLTYFFNDVKYFKQMNIDTDENTSTNFRSKESAIDPVIFIVAAYVRDHEIKYNIQSNKVVPTEVIQIIIRYYTPLLEESKIRLQFLMFVLKQNITIKLTEQCINTLWQAFIVNALTLQERNVAFISIKKLVHAGRPLKYIGLRDGVPEILFTKHMIQYMNPQNMSQRAYECFERYFVFINCQKQFLQMVANNKEFMVNNYDKLIGLDILWQTVISCTNDIVHQKSIAMINKLCNKVTAELKPEIGRIRVDILNKIMNKLSNSLNMHSAENTTAERILSLLHHFLNGSECRGLCGLRPHEALYKGKNYELIVINKINFGGYGGKPPQISISIHENDSLWDLRVVIGAAVDTFPELVKIYFQGKCFHEDKNSLSMQQLNINRNDTVHCIKKDHKSMRVPLLTGLPPRLVGKAKDSLSVIFHQFATNEDGTMSEEDCRKYIFHCGAGQVSASHARIQGIFTQHGLFNDRLSLPGFWSFYRSACMDRPDHVWNDLNVFKFRYDLRKEDEARKEEEILLTANCEILPRYMLTANNKYFDILFEKCLQCNDNKIKQMAWRLILRLPTNTSRKQEFMKLDKGTVDWEQLLPGNNWFKFVYGVLICEALVVEDRVNWKAVFLEQKGFEHLLNTLLSFKLIKCKDMKGDEEIKYKSPQQLVFGAVLTMVELFGENVLSCKEKMRLADVRNYQKFFLFEV